MFFLFYRAMIEQINDRWLHLMKIEFFHDVICSFCFPMSHRMREIQKKYPNVEIIHRSFALAWDEADLIQMFGSREIAKKEILSHWQQANENDSLHRFNITGMQETDFPFPTSKNGLLAAKSAQILGNEETYWSVFDKIQEKLFVENKNIESMGIIKEIILETDLKWEAFMTTFNDNKTLEAVNEDLQLAQNYGISGVPFLVINNKYSINGAQPLEVIEDAIQTIAEKEHEPLVLVEDGSYCYLDKNGTWVCE